MTARPIPVSKGERAPNASLFMPILIFPARGPAMADAPTGNSRAYTSARGAADTAPKEERREARTPAHAPGFGPAGPRHPPSPSGKKPCPPARSQTSARAGGTGRTGGGTAPGPNGPEPLLGSLRMRDKRTIAWAGGRAKTIL